MEALHEKVHNLGSDSFVIFLCAAANAPVATNTQLSNLTQIAYTNLSARTLTITSSSQTSGTYKWVLQDLVLTASGAVAPFRYSGIYNDTATNDELVCWFDHGSEITMANGETYTFNFDGTNGLFTAAKAA